ncbi:MAG TPA: hypothetical protein VFM55_12190 [Micromonosporaceae bacterium]|nr:hypothetical protein [Micromonosporaceae bacterium]
MGDQHGDALDRLRRICGAFPEVAELCAEAYRVVAPKRLVKLLDERDGG